jgi:hypothetical protein
MSAKRKMTLGIIGSVLVITPIAVALAQPQAAACTTIHYRGLDVVAPGIFASSDVAIRQRGDFVRLHQAAKLRIADECGATRASPVIVIGSTEALRHLFSWFELVCEHNLCTLPFVRSSRPTRP